MEGLSFKPKPSAHKGPQALTKGKERAPWAYLPVYRPSIPSTPVGMTQLGSSSSSMAFLLRPLGL